MAKKAASVRGAYRSPHRLRAICDLRRMAARELDGWAADMPGPGLDGNRTNACASRLPASLTAIVDTSAIAAPKHRLSWARSANSREVPAWNTRRIIQGRGVHRILDAGPGPGADLVTAGSALGLILRLADSRATKMLGFGNVAIDARRPRLAAEIGQGATHDSRRERPGRAMRGGVRNLRVRRSGVSLGEIEFGGTHRMRTAGR